MMTLAAMCEALDGKQGRPAMAPYSMEFLYADEDNEPLAEGEINIVTPGPERMIVLRAQDVTAARAEARERWERDRTAETDGYLVYQSDGVCVHGLNLRDPAEISRAKRTKTVGHVRTGKARRRLQRNQDRVPHPTGAAGT
jgi:hypothetical protein